MSCPAPEAIVALVEGRLPWPDQRELESHFDGCSSCSGVIAILRRGAEPSEPTDDQLPLLSCGDRLGRYEVRSFVGAGGMGAVYRARDRELGRDVALKILRHASSDDDLRWIHREAQAMARITHPAVVQVFDIGRHGPHLFIAMEHVAGSDLARRQAQHPLPAPEVIRVFTHAARGLHAAHNAGVVHRDFKPSNVLVRDDGRVFVTDFGLARWGDDGDGPAHASTTSGSSDTGRVLGTPGYMAPEQQRGDELGPPADQFALCVALYEALAGRRPSVPLPAALPAAVPPALVPILRRGLALDPDERWPSMRSVIDGLRGMGSRRSPRRVIMVGAAAALAVIGAGWMVAPTMADDRCADDPDPGWTVETADAVALALAASDSPLAAEASPRVRDALDAYSERWATAHAAVCSGPSDRFHAGLRCLRGARGQLNALSDRLVAPDMAIERAVPAATALPDPAACLREQSRFDAPPAELAEVMALYETGNLVDAHARASALVERGRTTAGPRLEAHARYLMGRIHRVRAELELAQREFTDAYHLASEADDPQLAASAATQMVRVAGESLHNPSRVQQWAGHARTALAAVPDPTLGEARLELIQGQVSGELGDPVVALQWTTSAVQTYRARTDVPAAERSAALRLHAGYLATAGRYDEADQAIAEAMTIASVFGPTHPQMGYMYKARAMVAAAAGRKEAAAADFARALDIMERVRGPDAAELYPILSGLCMARATSAPVEAEAACRRGLSIAAAEFGDSLHTARAMIHLADALPRDRREESIGLYRSASVVFRAELGPSNELLFATLNNIGVALEAEGRLADALPYLEEAHRIANDVFGDAHDLTAKVRTRLNRLRRSQESTDAQVHLRVDQPHDALEFAG